MKLKLPSPLSTSVPKLSSIDKFDAVNVSPSTSEAVDKRSACVIVIVLSSVPVKSKSPTTAASLTGLTTKSTPA